jgi:hypothetical protein
MNDHDDERFTVRYRMRRLWRLLLAAWAAGAICYGAAAVAHHPAPARPLAEAGWGVPLR